MSEKNTGKPLAGRVVVVTGAGGGLGRDIALYLGSQGASVVVNDLGVELDGSGSNTSRAQGVATEIVSAGGSAIANTDSVASWDSAHAIVQSAVDEFGRIDGVVNNAGIVRDRMFFKMSEEEWRAVIDVHLHGTFFMSRAAAPYFKNQESGGYVHMTSTSALIGAIGQANYSAAKLGIVGLSRSIANEMARYNVRSNCIAPFAWSRMTSSIPTDTPAQQARVEKLKKMEGAKVAPLVGYLVSEGASVSSQVFSVRANEIYLMSQHRPVRTMHRSQGWTIESISKDLIPALQASFTPLGVTTDVISWDPV